MSLGNNYAVIEAESEYEESLTQDILQQAAINVLAGDSREIAIQDAKDLIEAQQDAIANGDYCENPETHEISFWNDSLNDAQIPKDKEKQVHAIMNELYELIDSE